MFSVVVNSFDYGAYGKLRAVVFLKDGFPLDAKVEPTGKTTLTLPFITRDGSRIGDAAAIKHPSFKEIKNDLEDNDKQDNNTNNGDGLTAYEEYRGFIVKDNKNEKSPDPNKQKLIFRRTDPLKKNIFYLNPSNIDAVEQGMILFSDASKIKAIEITTGYSKVEEGIASKAGVINPLSIYASGGVQHAIIFNPTSRIDNSPNNLGITLPLTGVHGNSSANPNVPKPAKCLQILIATDNLNVKDPGLDYISIAHEAAHSLGVKHHGKADGQVATYFETNNVEKIYRHTHLLNGNDEFKLLTEEERLNYITVEIPKILKEGEIGVGIPQNAASGNVHCIMRYAFLFDHAYDKTTKTLIIIDFSHPYPMDIFCIDGIDDYYGLKGNKLNKVSIGKPNAFGDPTKKESCMSQFMVKDW
jgi:hypothetical protein